MGTLNVSFTASNQLQASRGLFSLESVGSQFAKSGTGGGALTVVTSSLTNATVGQLYTFTLSATGGTGAYSWNLVTCTPNTDLWLSVSNGAISGIPQLTETESVTVQVTDSVGNTAQANLNLTVIASGTLSIVTPPSIPNYYSAATSLQNGIFQLRMLASGGQPPYWWAFSGPAFTATGSSTGTLYAMSNFGWLSGACTASSGTDTLNVIVTDNNGATATKTVSVSATSTLQPYPKDSVTGLINLPTAYAGTPYQYQLHAAGGSGSGYSYTVISGMPSGLSLAPTGLIYGSPTLSGSANITLQVKDSASALTSFGCVLNIVSKNQVARPSYNTGTGFFVDTNGYLRDPSGYLFQIKGLNRTHYDSANWGGPASGALAYPNAVRVFMFDGQTASYAANQVTTQYAANNIAAILTLSGAGSGTSGSTSTALLQTAMADWVSYQSTLAPVMNRMIINLANEWGPTNSIAWQYAYQYQSGTISNISSTTVTISTVSGTNPFANSPFAYISGAGGISNQVVSITATGGSSGAWTITIGTSLSGYTSGGTLYGGAVGVARGCGYTCPILIDTGSSGEDPFDILNYSVAINNSDPQKNCIFSLHPYQSALPWQGIIQSVTQGNPTVLTLNSNWANFPLNPGASTAGSDNFNDHYLISGAQGLTQLNGIQPSDVHTFGSQNNWQVHLTVDSSAWVGTYVTNSAALIPASSSGRALHYNYTVSQLAALAASGVCAIIGEFGPGNQLGNPALSQDGSGGRANLNGQQVAPGQLISACESYGLGWIPWAWDDHSAVVTFPAQFANSWFACVAGNNGVYTANSQFTAFGLDVVTNPRYGLWARSQPSPTYQAQASNNWFGATLPTLPFEFTTTSSPPLAANTNRGSYYTPGTGGDSGLTVQAALNAAAAATGSKGDVIVLQAGTTYTASQYTLPTRSGSGWIYVISSQAPEIGGSTLPAAGTRVGPSNLSAMPSLRSTGVGTPLMIKSSGAAFYRFVGVDIELTDVNNICNYVIRLDSSDSSLTTIASNITFDRCYIDGAPSYGVTHAMNIDGQYIEVTECYFGDQVFSVGDADCQNWYAYNSPGPYRINNNRGHAGGQQILFGGTDSIIPGVIPSDLQFTNNSLSHNIWKGTLTCSTGSSSVTINSNVSGTLRISMALYNSSGQEIGVINSGSGNNWILTANASVSVAGGNATGLEGGKDMLELKCAQRALISNNYVLNPGGAGQQYSNLVTVRNQSGGNPQNTVSDITIQNNIFVNTVFSAWNILLQDGPADQGVASTQPCYRQLYRNNLWLFLNEVITGNVQTAIQIDTNPVSPNPAGLGGHVVFDHNTFVFTGNNEARILSMVNTAGGGGPTPAAMNNIVWSNNIFDKTSDEIAFGGFSGAVTPNVTQAVFINNVINQGTQTYPSGNFKPASTAAIGWTSYGSTTLAAGYALTGSSPYKGAGYSGTNIAYNGTGVSDGTDIGCNITLLPSS